MAHYFLSISTQPEIFEDEDEDEYGLQDFSIAVEAISEIMTWRRHFYSSAW